MGETVGQRYWIDTRKFGPTLRAILEHYAADCVVSIDGEVFDRETIPALVETWCTRRSIEACREFQVSRGGLAIVGFHDHPSDLWAEPSESALVSLLESRGLARCRLLPER